MLLPDPLAAVVDALEAHVSGLADAECADAALTETLDLLEAVDAQRKRLGSVRSHGLKVAQRLNRRRLKEAV